MRKVVRTTFQAVKATMNFMAVVIATGLKVEKVQTILMAVTDQTPLYTPIQEQPFL